MAYSEIDSLCVSPADSVASSASSDEWNFQDDCASAVQARRIVSALEREVRNMCIMNDGVETSDFSRTDGISRFFGKKNGGNVSMDWYMKRILRYLSCSSSTYVVAFVYLHRILKYEPRLAMSSCNAHRLYLTAVVLACKYLEDRVNSNRFYAKLGALSGVEEMNALESTFLNVMKFDLAVSPEEFNIIEAYLEGVLDLCSE